MINCFIFNFSNNWIIKLFNVYFNSVDILFVSEEENLYNY